MGGRGHVRKIGATCQEGVMEKCQGDGRGGVNVRKMGGHVRNIICTVYGGEGGLCQGDWGRGTCQEIGVKRGTSHGDRGGLLGR